ncbi:polyketide biosynthesis cytochrome P450 PksS [Ktedonobacteria bacterium brp13]|nr:polyketide biosynthesis cytochrome P450 PksS [Ktedonobacteria bacterium brp13]
MNNPLDQTTPQTTPNADIASLFSGELSANPFPFFAQMREMGAVVPIPFPIGGDIRAWMVTRIEEAVRILKDHEHFTVDPRSIGADDFLRQRFAGTSDDTFTARSSMISVDEPDHRRLRGLVSKVFTPRYMESLRSRVQEIADELLDEVQGQGQMDIVESYAFPLPINVISEMLGVPKKDRPQIRAWSEAMVTGGGMMGRSEDGIAGMRAFSTYTRHLVAEKRKQPQNDLISQLIAIEEEGDRLSEMELLSMITLLIFAGHETTSNLIGLGTLMLLDHSDQLAMLKADLSLVPSAVEELLRFNGPVTMPVPRFATEDIELAGQQIKKGDVLITALISANRDERQFTDPDELNIARTLNRHVAFGQGIHICLGAPLARLEGDIAFTTLLKRMPNVHLSVPRETITWRVSGNLRGLTVLPVAF